MWQGCWHIPDCSWDVESLCGWMGPADSWSNRVYHRFWEDAHWMRWEFCSEIRARYHPNPTPDRWPLESLPLISETGIQVTAVVGIGDHLGAATSGFSPGPRFCCFRRHHSIIVSLYQGKGVTLERRNYRGLKLLDQVIKMRGWLKTFYDNKCTLMTCNLVSCLDATPQTPYSLCANYVKRIYVVNERLHMAFIDLEKAFNRVPRRVIWWALRKLGIDKWLVRLIQSLHENAKSRVCVCCNLSSSQFWKPSPRSFVHDVPGKTYMQMTWSLLNRWRNYNRSWSSGRPAWKERDFGSTWAKPRSWYLGLCSMCFRN